MTSSLLQLLVLVKNVYNISSKLRLNVVMIFVLIMNFFRAYIQDLSHIIFHQLAYYDVISSYRYLILPKSILLYNLDYTYFFTVCLLCVQPSLFALPECSQGWRDLMNSRSWDYKISFYFNNTKDRLVLTRHVGWDMRSSCLWHVIIETMIGQLVLKVQIALMTDLKGWPIPIT